jgi:hypothetical protein
VVGGSVFLLVQNFAKIRKIELKREYIATIFLLVKKKRQVSQQNMEKKSSNLDSNFSFIAFFKIFTHEPKTCPSWNASQWHNFIRFFKKKVTGWER